METTEPSQKPFWVKIHLTSSLIVGYMPEYKLLQLQKVFNEYSGPVSLGMRIKDSPDLKDEGTHVLLQMEKVGAIESKPYMQGG